MTNAVTRDSKGNITGVEQKFLWVLPPLIDWQALSHYRVSDAGALLSSFAQ